MISTSPRVAIARNRGVIKGRIFSVRNDRHVVTGRLRKPHRVLETDNDAGRIALYGVAHRGKGDRTDGLEIRSKGNLALEPLQGPRIGCIARPDQLDGAGTLQKPVFGQVNLAHTAAADLAAEVILAELPGLGNLPAQHEDGAGPERRADRECVIPGDDVRPEECHRQDQGVDDR